jgi:membrane fusion protein, multidrug efflux system
MQQWLSHIWANKNYRISGIFVALTCLWMMTGLFSNQAESQQGVSVTDSKTLTSVKARYIYAEDFNRTARVRARTEANREVSLRAEISGRIVDLPAVKGSRVKKGDVVCELALEDRALRLNEAQAAVEQAQLEYDGSLRLRSGGYQSRTAIAGAKARLQTAKADFSRRQLDLENVKIRAPFAGVVEKHSVEVGDFVQRGDMCASVLDLDPLLVVGEMSETEVGKIELGTPAFASLLTGQKLEGVLDFIGRSSDTITRTFRVEVSVSNPDMSLYSGITSDLVIPAGNLQAHIIPPSLLSLDDEGRVGVRILDETNHVAFRIVELVGDHPRGVWITGLPEKSLLITVGQEYVSSGEEVSVTLEESNQSSVQSELQSASAPDMSLPISAPVAAPITTAPALEMTDTP